MRYGAGRGAEPGAAEDAVGGDRHEGANVIGADVAPFQGDAERGGRAFADEVGAADAEQIRNGVAAGFAVGPDGW